MCVIHAHGVYLAFFPLAAGLGSLNAFINVKMCTRGNLVSFSSTSGNPQHLLTRRAVSKPMFFFNSCVTVAWPACCVRIWTDVWVHL